MPRRKGSKNKVALSVSERIENVIAEIESLQEQIKDKKSELKNLQEQKEQENMKSILDAISKSGKSAEGIISLLSK